MFLDDEEATARIRLRRKNTSLWVAVTALTACVVMMLALIGTAHADDLPTFSQVLTPQLLVGNGPNADQRILFSALMVAFSVAAAGLWRLSLRPPTSDRRKKRSRDHINQS
ncbi:hypothetical protein [Rhizobium sp. FY34]|uniref:hypothetical protein n=1 Tax=Rhizobium sp. FY34 TaxID=2562309 RepID=UPI0010BFCF13|nr:hypothetical protein [Rhizobium sp. FY34]